MFRRRLITVLTELEPHEVQHYINTALPEEPDFDDLVWPSDPEGLTPPLQRVGAYSASLSALHRAFFGGSEDPPPRPQQAPRPAVVQQQPAASSSSDPAPAYLQQAALATRPVTAPPGPTQTSLPVAPDPVPPSAPAAAGASRRPSEPCFPHTPARIHCASATGCRRSSVRGPTPSATSMALAGATPTASSVTASVTIRPARLSVRGRTTA